MIALLRGTLVEKHPNQVIVEAGGVGYDVLIPISMDTLSVSGAGATIFSAQTIGDSIRVPIRSVALLPTIVNKRYGLTDVVMKMIAQHGGLIWLLFHLFVLSNEEPTLRVSFGG